MKLKVRTRYFKLNRISAEMGGILGLKITECNYCFLPGSMDMDSLSEWVTFAEENMTLSHQA